MDQSTVEYREHKGQPVVHLTLGGGRGGYGRGVVDRGRLQESIGNTKVRRSTGGFGGTVGG